MNAYSPIQCALSASYTPYASNFWTASYAITASYAPSSFANTNTSGFFIGGTGAKAPIPQKDGANRYFYYNDNEEDEILEKIEKENLVILDQSEENSEEKPFWYDVIDPKVLNENLKKPIPIEKDEGKVIDEITKELEKELKNDTPIGEIMDEIIDKLEKELKYDTPIKQPQTFKAKLTQQIKNWFKVFL